MGPVERIRVLAGRIKRDAMTLWFAMRDPRTPWLAKALGVFVVAYALSPIDLIPDFIPVLGLIDEVILLPLLLWLALRQLPPAVLADCRQQAEDWAARSAAKPRSLLGAALIVAVWLAVALTLVLWLAAGRTGH